MEKWLNQRHGSRVRPWTIPCSVIANATDALLRAARGNATSEPSRYPTSEILPPSAVQSRTAMVVSFATCGSLKVAGFVAAPRTATLRTEIASTWTRIATAE
jgi:hypothetical protein